MNTNCSIENLSDLFMNTQKIKKEVKCNIHYHLPEAFQGKPNTDSTSADPMLGLA